ncbi:MAG: hypothetical protein P9L88_06705 [Candidatus Tantalella remota]|nr:hypothetical protein [Candidatus Tantalella remota]
MRKEHILTAIDLVVHLVLSAILAVVFYVFRGGWCWPVLAVVGGVLIDVDHFLDYFVYFGKRFNVYDFFERKYNKSGKSYRIFHSWEIVILLWIFSPAIPWLFPLAAGVTGHILIDVYLNRHADFKALFLIYRWKHGFDPGKMTPLSNGEKKDAM